MTLPVRTFLCTYITFQLILARAAVRREVRVETQPYFRELLRFPPGFWKMFQYSEEYDFSLDLVKKCGEVIKKAFHSEKKIRSDKSCNILFSQNNSSARRALPMTW